MIPIVLDWRLARLGSFRSVFFVYVCVLPVVGLKDLEGARHGSLDGGSFDFVFTAPDR